MPSCHLISLLPRRLVIVWPMESHPSWHTLESCPILPASMQFSCPCHPKFSPITWAPSFYHEQTRWWRFVGVHDVLPRRCGASPTSTLAPFHYYVGALHRLMSFPSTLDYVGKFWHHCRGLWNPSARTYGLGSPIFRDFPFIWVYLQPWVSFSQLKFNWMGFS